MKKAVVLTVVIAFLLSVSAVFAADAPVKAAPVKAKSETFTGTVLKNKVNNKWVYSLQTDAETLELAGNNAQIVGRKVGKKVKVTGTVRDANGKKVLTVRSFSLVEEPAPPKKAQ